MLSMNDLKIAFAGARNDHPGRKGGYCPKRGSGHEPRFRKTKHIRIYGQIVKDATKR